MFGYCMLKPLREKNALVFIENFVGVSGSEDFWLLLDVVDGLLSDVVRHVY